MARWCQIWRNKTTSTGQNFICQKRCQTKTLQLATYKLALTLTVYSQTFAVFSKNSMEWMTEGASRSRTLTALYVLIRAAIWARRCRCRCRCWSACVLHLSRPTGHCKQLNIYFGRTSITQRGRPITKTVWRAWQRDSIATHNVRLCIVVGADK